MFELIWIALWAEVKHPELIVKLNLGLLFLFSVRTLLSAMNEKELLFLTDGLKNVLAVSIFLMTLQVAYLNYHVLLTGFDVAGSSSASKLYEENLIFFGLAEKNLFGAYFSLFTIYYLSLKRGISVNYKAAIYLTLMAVSYFTYSRTAVIVVGLGFITFLIEKRNISIGKLICICIFAIVITFILAHTIGLIDALENVISVPATHDDGMIVRLLYFKALIENIAEIPFQGYGLGGVGYFLSNYSPLYIGEQNIHNLYFNIVIELGFFSLIALIGFMLLLVIKSGKSSLAGGVFELAVPFFLLSLTLFALYDFMVWIFFSMLFVLRRLNELKLNPRAGLINL